MNACTYMSQTYFTDNILKTGEMDEDGPEAPDEVTCQIYILGVFQAGWQKKTDMLLAGRFQNRSNAVLTQKISLNWPAASFC